MHWTYVTMCKIRNCLSEFNIYLPKSVRKLLWERMCPYFPSVVLFCSLSLMSFFAQSVDPVDAEHRTCPAARKRADEGWVSLPGWGPWAPLSSGPGPQVVQVAQLVWNVQVEPGLFCKEGLSWLDEAAAAASWTSALPCMETMALICTMCTWLCCQASLLFVECLLVLSENTFFSRRCGGWVLVISI